MTEALDNPDPMINMDQDVFKFFLSEKYAIDAGELRHTYPGPRRYLKYQVKLNN